ncbi:MAG TPA: hypothetical protein VGM41_19925, partial [Chitinophagaceae bacterium]
MLLQVILKTDSLLSSKMDKLADSVEAINKKVTLNPWLPILAAVLGGVLVWIGQYMDRRAREKREIKKDLQDIFARAEMLLVLLKNSLKELAIQKNRREYWWVCYYDEFKAKNKNEENE